MSYRTIKRLLGETSLERKCRFLFGGALLLLITGSFYVYARLNLGIVHDQYRQRGSFFVLQGLQEVHAGLPVSDFEDTPRDAAPEMREYGHQLKELSTLFRPEDISPKSWKFLRKDFENLPAGERPSDELENEVLAMFPLNSRNASGIENHVVPDASSDSYQYFQPVYASDEPRPGETMTCYRCHQHRTQNLKAGDLLAVAKINFPLKETARDIARNNAVLIAMAIATAFLAMLASYAIVRYVIVKPVQHLKQVSDSVAHGDLDQRADIRTGDEFEELSHAFNRMLRHLVNTQEELRHVNTNLDAKVDELARANLSLHQMNKLKNEFLATMSHELRTPLNSILGFSDVLAAADNINERQKKYVANILTSGRSLLSLINDILDLAKIEAGKMDRHIVEFSISDLVERSTTAMMPLAERKNIVLQVDVEADLPLLRQDAGKLQQILYNLLSNAVKFTPQGGRVRVSAARLHENDLNLVVTDTGVGIPLEDQALVFEKFRQGRATAEHRDTLTREFEGTGLGLSIVKELSRLLGGEVYLESEFGKGSTFTVRIPIQLDCPLDFTRTGPAVLNDPEAAEARLRAFGAGEPAWR